MIQDRIAGKNKIVLWVSIGLYVLSLTQRCYCTTVFCGYSLMALLTGPVGLVFGGAALVWLSNPLLLTAWILFNKRPKISLLTSFLAVLISLSFMLFDKVIADEAGNILPIIAYRLGYWLWCASSLIMLIGNIVLHQTKGMITD